jgi:nucleoside-diphosphate-sugar epimerase
MQPDSGIILITGSSGLIGSAITRRLADRHARIIGLDVKEPTTAPPDNFTYIPFDITSDEKVRQALQTAARMGSGIASVIHLAAFYDFSGEPNSKYEEITVRGTGRLLRGLRELTVPTEQFVFSSTMLVHRPAEPGQFITEEWPLEPAWAYPESKVRTEELIRAEHGDIPAVLLRIAGVYDDMCHSVPLAHQIQRIYEKKMESRLFSGEVAHGQSFIHLDDLVSAVARVVERRRELPAELALLLGEQVPLSYDELQHTIARLLHGQSWETHEMPLFLARVGAWLKSRLPGRDPFIKPWMVERADDHYALDITRAREYLGWEPRHSLRATLPKMIAALRSDPENWYRQNKLKYEKEAVEA